ncbi:NCS2 family permease [Ruminococcaceae bacterium OttesenSCG-928-N02]|nr:NCS2 family permease [Ruminococcaceae bacterium OttesenSCG-928-N02]
MEKLFKIKERGSTVRTEIMAGITTFFAMAYIIFVNPNYLAATGMNFYAVMIATCLSAAVGCFVTAFLANVPFAQAPGMGLNAFFTYTLCGAMGYTWQQGLAIVFISGVLFLVITVSPLRGKIIDAIPAFLKSAISAGIGLFIAFIGLLNADIVKLSGDLIIDDALVATDYSFLGDVTHGATLLAIIGLLITGVLIVRNVKGAIFIGIVITTIIGIPFGLTNYTPMAFDFSVFGEVFMQMDFAGVLSHGVLPLVTAIISFTIVDMFDTVGTLLGTAENAGMLDENKNLPGGDKALIADAIATIAGAAFGTSTVTTYVESSTGIQEGGRTGLTTLTVGVLFLLAIVAAPVAGMVPSAATAPALIIVGVYMMKGAMNIDWLDFECAMPAFLTIAMMPFAYSISDGIGFGFISYAVLKVCKGKAKEVPVLIYILSALFLAKYILTFL